MEAGEFQYLSQLLKKRSGLSLTEDKEYLIETRLLPIARDNDCTTISELVAKLKANPPEELLNKITEAMTTNESLFFRDTRPFQFLREVLLPEYKKMTGKNTLRIWSSACSTGQEPYSIAMCLLEEAAKMQGWSYEILATDLAGKVVDKAEFGLFSQFEIQRGLPIQMLMKYFSQLEGTSSWQIKDNVRSMVTFRVQNLLDNLTPLGKFDMIFCRNVLIYFDEATRAGVIERLAGLLNQGGYLFLGGTETVIDKSQRFLDAEQCRGVYRLK